MGGTTKSNSGSAKQGREWESFSGKGMSRCKGVKLREKACLGNLHQLCVAGRVECLFLRGGCGRVRKDSCLYQVNGSDWILKFEVVFRGF